VAIAAALAMLTAPDRVQAQSSLPFSDLIFIERGIVGADGGFPTGGEIIDQYFGQYGLVGGGLFLLKDFQGAKQKVDIVAGLKVPEGKTNAGQTLSSGTFLSPDLSFDGKTLVFAWSSGGNEKWTAKNRFHLFKVDLDGKNLVQLTDGNFDDFHPAWMPNGRIIFVSTRRGGFATDQGHTTPSYTLHSMNSDGTDIIRLSHHVFNEFHPSIANDGRIVYTRYDHIDRDNLAAHHIWWCNPDGSNPLSYGGNYALPLDTMGTGPWIDGRKDGKRPMAELYPRSIPGSATKYVAVAGPHHGEAYGTLIIRDLYKVDDNKMGQVTKLTPEVGFPDTADKGTLTYGPAWPLSETLFLTSYDNSLVLLDTSVTPAKRTEYYRTSKGTLRPIYPIPAAPRTAPPKVMDYTVQGERWTPSTPPATIVVDDVTNTDAHGKLPTGVKIKSMRIVQVLPKTTTTGNDPRLGYSSYNIAKVSLGTVPVEDDGSVFFEAPIGREILFQLLDEKGMAVQTMRSGTYVHPGENMTCNGCHEEKFSCCVPGGTPLAAKRAASKMEPELGRVEPINFARHVAPVLTKCASCHVGKPAAPTLMTKYGDVMDYAFWFSGGTNGNTEPVHGGSRSKPGMIGARGSRMGKALLNDTHQQAQAAGKYNDNDVRTLTQWLDLGSDELGSWDDPATQRLGKLVWPSLDFDKDDPQGLKYKPESPLLERKDAGASGPDLPAADVPQADASPVAKDGASGGATAGATGTAASGGQSGSGSQMPVGGTGGITTVDTGGAGTAGTASTAVGGQSGSGGGIDAQASGGKGGPSQSGSQKTKLGSASACSCTMGAKPDETSPLWLLLIMGLALFGQRRRDRRR
jgi:MYXO-CTERM domain-containing protein